MGGLFSTSYEVQKVGQTVRTANRRSTSTGTGHEIKTTQMGNNVFAKSDIEIIGPIGGMDSVKKEDGGKTVRIDESKTEVFEHVEVSKEPPPPPIDEEERKKQEDLMMAMVRGEIHPRDSICDESVKETAAASAQIVNLITSTIEIVDEQPEAAEELVEEESVIAATEIKKVVDLQVNNAEEDLNNLIGTAEDNTNSKASTEKETPTEESKKSETVESTNNKALADIHGVEKAIKSLKDRIIHFNSTTKNNEYEDLHQAIVSNMLKLDDIVCDTDEATTERKRVIKILQQWMESLERKIETAQNVESDSE